MTRFRSFSLTLEEAQAIARDGVACKLLSELWRAVEAETDRLPLRLRRTERGRR